MLLFGAGAGERLRVNAGTAQKKKRLRGEGKNTMAKAKGVRTAHQLPLERREAAAAEQRGHVAQLLASVILLRERKQLAQKTG